MCKPKPQQFRMTKPGHWQTVVSRCVVAAKLRAARKRKALIHRMILVGCFAYETENVKYYPIWS